MIQYSHNKQRRKMDTAKLSEELLAYAEERVGKGKYAFATGFLMAMLTEEQWARIQEIVDKETLV